MPEIDDTDQRIIAELRRDGRLTNAQISRSLGVSEALVRRRIERLINNRSLRIIAVTNPYKKGYTLDAIVNMRVEVSKLKEAAAKVAELPEVRYAAVVAGDYNLTFRLLLRSQEEFYHFVTDQLAAIPGIETMETAYVLKVVRRTFDWIPEQESGLSQLEANVAAGLAPAEKENGPQAREESDG